jgi:hypothetical protein
MGKIKSTRSQNPRREENNGNPIKNKCIHNNNLIKKINNNEGEKKLKKTS